MRFIAVPPLALALLFLVVQASRAEIVLSRLDASSAIDHARDLAAAADGRLVDAAALAALDSSLASVAVACALPSSASVTLGGVEYLGESGLAPAWRRRELDARERRLVTACVLAHVSGPAVAVPVSLRGPRLDVDPDEASAFSVEEGAFFGDVATGQLLACSTTSTVDRTCAEPSTSSPGVTRCGFTYAGPCAAACRRRAGRWTQCRWPEGRTDDVVTVHVRP